jgi:Asp-tRNA(Asn)/Glu-tRNA(Gln) amidotransferase B subunit
VSGKRKTKPQKHKKLSDSKNHPFKTWKDFNKTRMPLMDIVDEENNSRSAESCKEMKKQLRGNIVFTEGDSCKYFV